MIESGNDLQKQQEQFEEQLKKLPGKKWQIIRLILVGIIGTFVLPYIPMRKGALADRMSYEDSAIMFGVIFIIVVPIGCYMHIQKINTEINDVEWEIEQLKKKREKNSENSNQTKNI